MLKNKILIILTVVSLFAINTFANNETHETFNAANKAYNAKEYQRADALYTSLVNQEYFSKELFFNLGNTNYKLGKIPQTIYYYEKALKLSPGDEGIIHNLKLANKRIADKNTVQTSRRISDLIYSYIKASVNFWAYTSVAIMTLGGLGLITFMTIQKLKVKKTTFYISTGLLLIGLVTIYIAHLQDNKLSSKEHGIVFQPSVELKTEPSDNSNPAFVLHEGTKVKLLTEKEDWCEISFGKGQIAWIKKEAIKLF